MTSGSASWYERRDVHLLFGTGHAHKRSTPAPPGAGRGAQQTEHFGAEPLVRFHPSFDDRTRRSETEELIEQRLRQLIIYSSRCKQ
jgi:hypothetical protein